MIPFNKPFYSPSYKKFLNKNFGKFNLVGNGHYTNKAEKMLEKIYNPSKVLLTTSCTHALEMAAILINIKKNDEVLMPAYTFSSTANAFLLRGAKIKFIDSSKDSPQIDLDSLKKNVSFRTKCVVLVHYGGYSCDIDKIIELKKKFNFYLIEDAAQCIGSKYKKKYLGTIGDLGCLSFHETKNLSCGEGGALIINKKSFINNAEIIREKGTNRKLFVNGKINKYRWVNVGSSYIPSDLLSSLLVHQLRYLNILNKHRLAFFNKYLKAFYKYSKKSLIITPEINENLNHNAHIFYIVFKSEVISKKYINYMLKHKIQVNRHYQCLSHSFQKYFKKKTNLSKYCQNSLKYSNSLVRLPLHSFLNDEDLNKIIRATNKFLEKL